MTIPITTRRTIARGIKTRHRQDMKLARANQTKIQKLTKAARAAKVADKPVKKQPKSDKARRTIVMAHRGGNFGPDNSLKNFRGAIENKVEGVEFDVSITIHSLSDCSPSHSLGLVKQRQRANDHSWR